MTEEFKEDLEQASVPAKPKPWWETRGPAHYGEAMRWQQVQTARGFPDEVLRDMGLPTLEDLTSLQSMSLEEFQIHIWDKERLKSQIADPELVQILNDPDLKRIAQDALRH